MVRKKIKENTKIVFLSLFLTIFITIGILVYLQPRKIFFSKHQIFSKKVLDDINTAVDKSKIIVGIQIVSVNLQKNSGQVVYAYIRDESVKKDYDNFESSNIIPEFPIFTKSANLDQRIEKIINHEFVCESFENTVVYKYMPNSADTIKYVCAISIPPSFGEFNGIVDIFLYKDPTDLEKDLIRILIKTIADDASLELKH